MLDKLRSKVARGLVFIAIQVHPAAVGSYVAKIVERQLKKRKAPSGEQSLNDSLRRQDRFDGEPVMDMKTGEVLVGGKPLKLTFESRVPEEN